MVMSARLESMILRGNKTKKEGTPIVHTWCNQPGCTVEEREDERHLTMRCEDYAFWRRVRDERVLRTMNENVKRKYLAANEDERMNYLLGKKIGT